MQFLNSLTDNKLLTLGAAIAAFLVFAVLILLFVRLLFGNRLRMGAARGRQQRLGVVDAYDMDRQRQLVLVRRDNTEHLVLIGGPNDLLIESSIVRVEARERSPRDGAALEGPARVSMPEPRDIAPEPMRPPLEMPRTIEPARVAPIASPAPVFVPSDVAPAPAPSADTPLEAALVAEPAVAEPAARETRLPDLFARMRAGRAAASPPAADEPAPAPVVPPPADAEFFETEIARALAPSLRDRPVASPPSPPPLPAAHMDSGAAEPEAAASVSPAVEPAPVAAPRAPFRPFPRREPSAAPSPAAPSAFGSAPGTTAGPSERPAPPMRPAVPRPPPPPFFSRMTAKAKEREEVSVPSVADVADGDAKAVSQEPVTLFPEPNSSTASPAPRIEMSPVITPAPRVEMQAAEPSPPALAEPAAAPLVREPPPAPAAAHGAEDDTPAASDGSDDPFAEEMARLLGRPPSKHG